MRGGFGLLIAAALLPGVVPPPPGWGEPAPLPRASEPEPQGFGQGERDGAGAFGRWERSLGRCRLTRAGAGTGSMAPPALACSGVRLDQQLEGLLSVRFLARAAAPGALPGQLVFAGVLAPGSRPMRCQEGRCLPQWPIRLQVSALARGGLIEGPAAPLLQARLAQGSCELSARRLQCSARTADGETWSVEGRP